MKKIVAFILPLLFLSFMIIQVGALIVVPCEVERIKDLCFIRVKGDYPSQSFLICYVNISPVQQEVGISRHLWTAPGITPMMMMSTIYYTLAPGESIVLTTNCYGFDYLRVRILIDNSYPPIMDEYVKIPSSP